MKKINLLAIGFSMAFLLMLGSCKKSDSTIDLTKGLTGTYEGTLEINGLKTTDPASTIIAKVNDYSINIHCFNSDFDTTFMMDLYANGDSTMVCFTDTDFLTEYHHQMTGGHHMMGDSNWQSWSNHMNTDHSTGDKHYGGFSMTDHTFIYRFKTPGSETQISKVFTGTRVN
ncbi:MAG: hypothetical protein WC341_17425 [Bacteroidales bacterium]|jgi:hypothetical protein